MTIQQRFSLIIALQTALVLVLVGIISFLVLQRFLEAGEERSLREALPLIEVHGELEHASEVELRLRPDFPAEVDVRVLQGDRVVATTGNFPPLPLRQPDGYSRTQGHQVFVRDYRGEEGNFTLQLATDLEGVREPLRAYLRALALTIPLLMLFAAGLSALTAGRLLKPVRELEQAALNIGQSGNLRQVIPYATAKDELGRLAQTLETSFRRIADMLERETEFTRAAAHDLRTPLTALKSRIDATLARERSGPEYQKTLQELGQDVSRMSRLTNHLLLLARDEAALKRVPVNLADLAGDSVDRARERNPDVPIEFEVKGQAKLNADPNLLSHLLDNLLDNAVKHGGRTPVKLRIEAGQEILLEVSDEGPGVQTEALAKLGETFYRSDSARQGEGSGLGLAIVKHIVMLHQARWQLVSEWGKGFAVKIWFPSARSG
ncbi:MAG: HAMP domain-containing protein [Trueperaceae bacterium]|nr:HAMP domain-containing protein [Trueperaceae bacterium]